MKKPPTLPRVITGPGGRSVVFTTVTTVRGVSFARGECNQFHGLALDEPPCADCGWYVVNYDGAGWHRMTGGEIAWVRHHACESTLNATIGKE